MKRNSLCIMMWALVLFVPAPRAVGGIADWAVELGFNPFRNSSAISCSKYLVNASGRGTSMDGPRLALARLTHLIDVKQFPFKTVEPYFLGALPKLPIYDRDITEKVFKLWVRNADAGSLAALWKVAPPEGFFSLNAYDFSRKAWVARLIFDMAASQGKLGEFSDYFDRIPLPERAYVLTHAYPGDYSGEGKAVRAQLGIPLSLELARAEVGPMLDELERAGRMPHEPSSEEGNGTLRGLANYIALASNGGYLDSDTAARLVAQEAHLHDSLFTYPQIELIATLQYRLKCALTVSDPAVQRMHNTQFGAYVLPVGFDGLPNPEVKVRNLYHYANTLIEAIRRLQEKGSFDSMRGQYLIAIEDVGPEVISFYEKYFPGVVPALKREEVSRDGLARASFTYPTTVRQVLSRRGT